MATETLGEAWRLGWKLTARCAFGKRDGMKSIRECSYRAPLDMGDRSGECVSRFEGSDRLAVKGRTVTARRRFYPLSEQAIQVQTCEQQAGRQRKGGRMAPSS